MQDPSKTLNPYEEQMFQEAYALVSEIKGTHMNEAEKTAKKNRLNYILSTHPKVHNRLKQSLLPTS